MGDREERCRECLYRAVRRRRESVYIGKGEIETVEGVQESTTVYTSGEVQGLSVWVSRGEFWTGGEVLATAPPKSRQASRVTCARPSAA